MTSAPGDPLFKGERFRKNLALRGAPRPIAAAHGVTVAQVALNWTLQHPAVTVAIAGAKRRQVEENVGGQGWQFSPDEVRQIQGWLADLPSL